MLVKFAITVALLLIVACANVSDILQTDNSNKDIKYGAVLTSVSCPLFFNWLKPTHIQSSDKSLSTIAEAEVSFNCESNYSTNRKTPSVFIPLPAGNYFFSQQDKSHLFTLSHNEHNAFSFKIHPNTITYIGEITLKAVKSLDEDGQFDLEIEVGDMETESLMLAREQAPSYMKDYPIEKMLWRPVIETTRIDRKNTDSKPKRPWVKDTSPESFF